MRMGLYPAVFAAIGTAAAAGPDLECDGSSQVEIGNCIQVTLNAVDRAIDASLGFAQESAAELDRITERAAAVPALEAGQAAWSAFRDAHCEFVGSTFGGGSGTGIAIASCRVMLGRDRAEELLRYAQ